MIIGTDINKVNSKPINNKYKIDTLLSLAKKTAISAGGILMEYYGEISSYKRKSTGIDLLTDADIQSEKHIINQIRIKYPDHDIITEETDTKSTDSDYQWIIDPLDGTTNFVHNLPIFSVSIGLKYKKETIVGVVYNPAVNKVFYASKGNGAYLDNKKIKVSSCSTLSNSLIVTGFPYLHDNIWDLSFKIFHDFYSQTQGLRRLGAASLDLCFVAMGRFDGFYEFNLMPWDICAGELIAKEAGGIVTDWDGSKNHSSGKRILATNKKIHKEMTDILLNKKYRIFMQE